MNYHIVRMNETLEKISLIYNLDINEIKDINYHVRDWNKLVPGTKIILPAIPESTRSELDDVEPFIEEYYPKIEYQTTPIVEENNLEDQLIPEPEIVAKAEVEIESKKSEDVEEVQKTSPSHHHKTMMQEVNYPKSSIFYNGYYPLYPPYYPYYPPYNLRPKTKNRTKK